MTKEITCLYCGVEGVIRTPGLHDDTSSNIFKYLGRNHVSGHRHYQCPICKTVLLVDPALIRANDPIFAREPIHYRRVSAGSNLEDFVKSPDAALRFMHRRCSAHQSTPG